MNKFIKKHDKSEQLFIFFSNNNNNNNNDNNNNKRTNGLVNAHLISWPSKAQNIQNLENMW